MVHFGLWCSLFLRYFRAVSKIGHKKRSETHLSASDHLSFNKINIRPQVNESEYREALSGVNPRVCENRIPASGKQGRG